MTEKAPSVIVAKKRTYTTAGYLFIGFLCQIVLCSLILYYDKIWLEVFWLLLFSLASGLSTLYVIILRGDIDIYKRAVKKFKRVEEMKEGIPDGTD